MKIAAVIVTYNRKNLLLECINSLFNQTKKVDKIFIIDNHSTDGTEDLLKTNGFLNNKTISYIKLESNLGGAGGFYEGIKKANQEKYDWIWVMDDDVIANEDALEQLLIAKDRIKEKFSFLASTITGEDGSFINVPWFEVSPRENGYANNHRYLSSGLIEISAATFVSILIKNEAIDKIGYPVKDYFIWGDDTEYTLRLTRHYGPAFLVGKSKATHKRAEAKALSIFSENKPQKIQLYYFLYRNSLINTKTYFGKKTTLQLLRNYFKERRRLLIQRNLSHRFLKIRTISKAMRDFIFHNYNCKSFEQRFKKNVKWKGVTLK